MAFIIGLCAENCKLHWTFQANTVRHKRTLSLIYLGIMLLFTGHILIIFTKLRGYGVQNVGEVPNHYETLDVRIDCTTNKLKEAFDLKKRQNKTRSPQFMEKINLAFNTLKDSNSRESYNAMLWQKEINDARATSERLYLNEERRLDSLDFYELLHLLPGMTDKEISSIYQQDRFSYNQDGSSRSRRALKAYSTLITPLLRAEYDTKLANQKAEKMRTQIEQKERQERYEAIVKEKTEKAKAEILKQQYDINLREAQLQLQLQQEKDEKDKRWMEANPQYCPRHDEKPFVAYSGVGEFIGDVAELPVFIMSLYVQAPITQCAAMMSCDFSIDNPPKHLFFFVCSPITIAFLAAKKAVIVPARVGITLGGLFSARTASSAQEVQTLPTSGASLGGPN